MAQAAGAEEGASRRPERAGRDNGSAVTRFGPGPKASGSFPVWLERRGHCARRFALNYMAWKLLTLLTVVWFWCGFFVVK